jgi:uncharacterized protein DUF6152
MTWYRGSLLLIVCGFMFALPALAHHSFSAEFDSNHIITLNGVITKVDWINPHAYWYMDVKTDKGDVEHWSLEGYGPSQLREAKVGRDSAGKPGDMVSIDAFMAKDGTKHLAHIKAIRFADGREITMWVKVPDSEK